MTAILMVPARSPCPEGWRAWKRRIAATPNCPGRNCWALALIYAPPVHMIKLNREREITTYVWVAGMIR
jgi:hypothetical protein